VEAPAVLLEVGFISHPDEGKKLQDAAYQDKLAEAVARGIQAFFDEVSRRDGKAAQSSSAPR
jgi:N-acetylmuramoyl-L-alanine amidase